MLEYLGCLDPLALVRGDGSAPDHEREFVQNDRMKVASIHEDRSIWSRLPHLDCRLVKMTNQN
jgi:hypothetical protein